MSTEVFLSICIPTFNRASYLTICLESIAKQVGNNHEVEVIISDNASDDGTNQIGLKYSGNYTNIKYFRNDINIGGNQNFIAALKRGQGRYLKLLNDYLEFKEGGVLKMLEIVKNHAESKEILYFADGVSYLKKREFHYSKNLDEFLNITSYWSTWIGSFGIWKEDFWFLLDHYTFKTSAFLQTELLFESFMLRKKAVTYSRPIFTSHDVVNKQTGYNFFDLFINTYLNKLIVGLKNENKITDRTYLREKNRFFTNFIFKWFKKIKIKKDHSIDFNAQNMERLIFQTYKYDLVFYLYLFYLPFYLIGFYWKKLIKYFKSQR